VSHTPHVTNVASFVGAGAPRFYYAISPELSTPSYAQLVVNTTSPDGDARRSSANSTARSRPWRRRRG
jgi:hypothetical protein